MKAALILTLILSTSPPSLLAARPQAQATDRPLPLAVVLEHIKERCIKAAGERRIRLAVMPFQPSEAQKGLDRGFGTLLTERTFSILGSAGPSIRLFERARLDAVIKEQKFTHSGLVSEEEAKKLGELAPIDFLLIGTFTRMDRSVAVHARLLDVVSGEVTATHTDTVELTSELAALFATPGKSEPIPDAKPSKAEPPPCDPTWAPVKAAMADSRTPEQVSRLVDLAMQIPFAPPCGAIHHSVVSHLIRYKLPSPSYAAFLRNVLPTIEEPDEDNRLHAIHRFLEQDGLDDGEWDALVAVYARSHRMTSYFSSLFQDKAVTAETMKRNANRAARLLEKVDAKAIGRPVPLEPGKAFAQLFGTFRSVYLSSYGKTSYPQPVLALYRTHHSRFSKENDKELLNGLTALFSELSPGKDRDDVVTWIGQRMANHPSREALGGFMGSWFQQQFREKTKQGNPLLTDAEWSRLASLAGPAIVQALPHVRDRETSVNIRRFCLAQGLKGPGIPTLEELQAQLAGEDVYARREAVRMMTGLGPKAAAVEPQVLKMLRRGEHSEIWQGQGKYVMVDLLEFLGHLQTRTPEAHQILVKHLNSLEYLVYEAAMHALAAIGEPAVPVIMEAYSTSEDVVRIRIAKIFKAMGTRAKNRIPWLKAQLAEAKRPHLKDALEDALEAVSAR